MNKNIAIALTSTIFGYAASELIFGPYPYSHWDLVWYPSQVILITMFFNWLDRKKIPNERSS